MCVCFVKHKTAYEMRISDWSSDVCSSDLSTIHGNTLAIEGEACFTPELLQRGHQPVAVGGRKIANQRAHEVMADVRKHEPGCGKVAWSGRNQHPSKTGRE